MINPPFWSRAAQACNRLVFSSIVAVYGNADSKALPESYPCAPINPYGASKWMIERILADYRSAYGLGSFCLRYINASGADASGGIGELRDNSPRHDGPAGSSSGLRGVWRRLRHARRHRDPRLH
jgi:UDP-glucose 4-epimerase